MNTKEVQKIHLYTDGGARGNPGPSGIGAWAKESEGEIIFELSKYIGTHTNNFAEYEALIEGLHALHKKGKGVEKVLVHMDSELIVKQMKGEYKVRDVGLKKQHERVKKLLEHFSLVSFTHIPREKNARADELANIAMDKGE